MGLFSKAFKLVKKVAPYAAVAAPFAFPALLPAIGGAFGATGLGASALGGAVLGGGAGALSGGLKGGLLGGVTGGVGGYLSAGGLGSLPSKGLAAGVSGPSSPGTGLLGSLGRGTGLTAGSGLGSALGAAGGGGSSYGPILSPLASTALGSYSNSKAVNQLNKAQGAASAQFDPFANESFTPGDLTATPGYQFQLGQGQQALDRKSAAGGNYFSGQALKEAQDYGQGLAGTTYQDAYNNFLQTQAQKLGAVGQQAGLTQGIGQAQATGTLNQGQLLAQGASSILDPVGSSNQRILKLLGLA